MLKRLLLLAVGFGAFAADRPVSPSAMSNRYSMPSNGLIGLYWINEGSGLTLHDSSPNVPGRCGDMPLSGSPIWYPAPEFPWYPAAMNVGIKFAAPGDYATIPTACSGNIKSAAFLMQPAADYGNDPVSYQPLLGSDDRGTIGMILLKQTTRAPMIWNGGTTNTVVDLGIWGDGVSTPAPGRCIGGSRVVTYVTGAADSDHIYCDALEALYRSGSLGKHSGLITTGKVKYLGNDGGYPGPMTTPIKAIAFYNRPLSAEDVKQVTRAMRTYFSARTRLPILINASGDSITDACPAGSACPAGEGENWDQLTAAANATQLTFSMIGQHHANHNTVAAVGGEGGWIVIDNEYMHVVSTTPTSFTVAARGANATTHNNGAYVRYAWPIQLQAMLQSRVQITNSAAQGQAIDKMYQQLAFGYGPQYYWGSTKTPGSDLVYDTMRPRVIDISSECINSHPETDLNLVETWMTKYLADRALAGIEAVAMSCTAINRTQAFQTARLAYNAWLKANYKALGAVAYVDLDSDPALNPSDITSVGPPLWESDGVHISSVGQFHIAQKVVAVLNTLGVY